MGTFYVRFEVGDREGRVWRSVDALVDTGASYTWIPEDVLKELGLEPDKSLEFEIADGSVIQRGATETRVRSMGDSHTTWVVFGDPSSDALLGAYTLEGFALAPDPVNQRLVPTRLLAK